MRTLHTLGLVSASTLFLTSSVAPPPASFKGPQAIYFSGGGLTNRVVVQGRLVTDSLFRLLEETPASSADVARDTSKAVSVDVVWNAPQLASSIGPGSSAGLWSGAAEDHGRLYAATRTTPPLVVVNVTTFGVRQVRWKVTPAAARMLTAHGLPAGLFGP